MRGLKDKVAIVTGAAGGLGGGSARRLAHERASVVCVDLDGDAAEWVADEIGGVALAADVSSEADADRYLATTVERTAGSTCTI